MQDSAILSNIPQIWARSSKFSEILASSWKFDHVQGWSSMFKHVHGWSSRFKQVQAVSSSFKHVQACSSLFKHVQVCSSMFRHVQVCSSMFKHIQACFKHVQACSSRFEHVQACSSRVKQDQAVHLLEQQKLRCDSLKILDVVMKLYFSMFELLNTLFFLWDHISEELSHKKRKVRWQEVKKKMMWSGYFCSFLWIQMNAFCLTPETIKLCQ